MIDNFAPLLRGECNIAPTAMVSDVYRMNIGVCDGGPTRGFLRTR